MGRECGFPSILDMPWPFTRRRIELWPIKSPNGSLYPRVEVEQRTHSGDDTDPLTDLESSELSELNSSEFSYRICFLVFESNYWSIS